MRREIPMLMVCVSGLLLLVGTDLRADEPATEPGVIPTMAGSEVLEDTGYARISRRDWTPPTSILLGRSPLVYSRMYPDKFYGQHGPASSGPVRRYPIIAMPTDTSQMGFYYRHVPQWQPRADMLPPIPRPSRWHIRPVPPSQRIHRPVLKAPPIPSTQALRGPATLR
jgi:hypothetical protein